MPSTPHRADRARAFLKFARSPDAVRKVLVVRSGMLGDTVFITPLLRRLRDTFRTAEIHVAVGRDSAALLKNLPVDQVHELRNGRFLLREAAAYLRLKKFRFDVAVILETNSHYTLMSRLLGARYLVGYENRLSSMLDHAVPWGPRNHFAENAVEPVREWTIGSESPRPWLLVSDEEESDALRWLEMEGVPEGKLLVCIHPWTSVVRAVRQWDPARYAPLADALIDRFDCAIGFSGRPDDLQRIDAIRALMRHPSVNLAPHGSLRQILAIMKRSSLVIGPDTGILHMATGVSTPVLMIMGETDPLRTGPCDPGGLSRVVRWNLPCSPCLDRSPKPVQWETCKSVWPTVCMQMLSVERVFLAAEGILSRVVASARPADRRKAAQR